MLSDEENKMLEIFKKEVEKRAKNDFVSKDKIKAKIEIRKEEKANCKDSIEEKYIIKRNLCFAITFRKRSRRRK